MKWFILLQLAIAIVSPLLSIETTKPVIGDSGPMTLDSEGNMFFCCDDHSIIKYSAGGDELLRFGRDGEGPSDLRRISHWRFNRKDSLIYVTEYYEGNRRVSRFNTRGQFAGVWDFAMDWTRYDVVSTIFFDSAGNVYLKAGKQHIEKKSDFQYNTQQEDILKFSPDGRFLGVLYSFRVLSDAFSQSNFTVTVPFKNTLTWLTDRDRVIVRESAGDSIVLFSADGRPEKKIPFPVRREKVTEKDVDEWERYMSSIPFIRRLIAEGRGSVKKWRERLTFPDFKPATGKKMFAGPDNDLYLTAWSGYGATEESWYRIGLESGKLETVRFKPGYWLVLIEGRFFYFSDYRDGEDFMTITKVEANELGAWRVNGTGK